MAKRNPGDWRDDPVELEKLRGMDRDARAGRRTHTRAGARRRDRWQAFVREQGAEAMRAIGKRNRRRRELEKRLAGTAGKTVAPGRCKQKPGACCRKGGRFAPCGAPSSRADFCFRGERSCCRDGSGRFISCRVPAEREELSDLKAAAAVRDARLARRRDEARVLLENPPKGSHLVGLIVRDARGRQLHLVLKPPRPRRRRQQRST